MGRCPLENIMNATQKSPPDESIASSVAVQDSGRDENRAVYPLNWDAILAAILVIGGGGGFWAGAGLMIAHLWK
jgi:hypothetical protein